MRPSLPSLPLPLTWHPKQTWYLLVELNGISATLGFLSLIFLTEPQDSSMHLSRADSEASPAVSRCQQGEFSVTVEDQGGRALTSPRQPQGARGESWASAKWAGCGDPPTPYLRHRDVLLPCLEDSTVAETSNPGQGGPRGGSFVESGPWEERREKQELGSPLDLLSHPTRPTTPVP